jgi:hypothetical protein
MKTLANALIRPVRLGRAKTETRGVASPWAPDDNLQHKPMPGLTAD